MLGSAARCSTARSSAGPRIESTRTILESGIVGAYHAVFKGRGIEFAEVREYAPGDDVRSIDWNVTARMGAAVRQEVRRGARPDRAAAGRRLGLAALRLALPAQARLRRRAGGRAGVLGRRQPRSRRGGPLHRSDRGLHRARPRPATTRCASCATSLAVTPSGRGTDLAGGPALCAQRVLRAAQHRGGDLGLPGRGGGLRAAARHPAPAARRHCRPALRSPRAVRAGRGAGGAARSGDGRARGRRHWPTRPTRARLRVAPLEAARETFRRTRVDGLALSIAEPYECPLSAFFKARERRR